VSLRYIVPTLGLVSFTAVPAMAAEVGDLTIDGYVDSVLEISDGDDAARGADSDVTIDFAAAAQLEVGYDIGDDVSANVELFWEDDDDGTNATDTELEQAYISWAINEQFSIVSGKFHNSIGWEALDAPGLYRVNNSHMYDSWGALDSGFEASWGVDTTGAGVVVDATEEVEIGFFIVDGIYAEDGKGTDALGFNAYATVDLEGIGVFDLDLMFGQEEAGAFGVAAAAGADPEDVFGIDLNGEIDSLREDQGLLFAFDFNYVDYDEATGFGLLAMANYALPTEVPASVSLFLNYVEPDDDTDDDESLEIALALLSNPTDNENFSLNAELAFISRELDDGDEFGFFVEALAVVP